MVKIDGKETETVTINMNSTLEWVCIFQSATNKAKYSAHYFDSKFKREIEDRILDVPVK